MTSGSVNTVQCNNLSCICRFAVGNGRQAEDSITGWLGWVWVLRGGRAMERARVGNGGGSAHLL